MPQHYTLSEAITEAIERFAPNEAPTRYFSAALKPAQAWRRTEFVPSAASELKTAYLEVGEDMTVPLPDDYANYTVLGIQLPGWGSSRNLIYNGSLSKLPQSDRSHNWLLGDATPDFLEPPTAEECEANRYGVLDDGYDGYCGFGAPSFGAEFRIDHRNRCVVLNSRVPVSAVLTLEYYGFRQPDGEDIPLHALAYDWAVQATLSGLYAMKKDWQAKAEADKEALRLKREYKKHTRNLSPEGVQQANHEAAAQRWK